MEMQTTHETTVRGWFTPDTMPTSWKAAEPAACNELAQLLQDKVLKAYNIGLLDGAARRTDTTNPGLLKADSSMNACVTCLLEAIYVIKQINWTFTPEWGGEGMDTRKGKDFILQMEIASGLAYQTAKKALHALNEAQVHLGLDTAESVIEPTFDVA